MGQQQLLLLVLGIVIAIAGTRLLTLLLANGDNAFALLQVDLNWRVLAITLLILTTSFGSVPTSFRFPCQLSTSAAKLL